MAPKTRCSSQSSPSNNRKKHKVLSLDEKIKKSWIFSEVIVAEVVASVLYVYRLSLFLKQYIITTIYTAFTLDIISNVEMV